MMSISDSTTNILESTVTQLQGNSVSVGCSPELRARYYNLLDERSVHWKEVIEFSEVLGQGGQGVVFLSERRGTDCFKLPIAVKMFSPERYPNDIIFEEEMNYMALMAQKVAEIQHDHLLTVHNWRSIDGIRLMDMELVDGVDLSRLLRQEMFDTLQTRVSASRWRYLNEVVVTVGQEHPRLKPGIAVPIIRDCLGGLGALHRSGIVHGDIKPSNIMLKRTGNAKVVDIGSAFLLNSRPATHSYTMAYAAPEILQGKGASPQSDIASLGYVLIEILSGRKLFGANSELNSLDGRLMLASRLHKILPPDVASSELLLNFCKGLIAPDPGKRFENAEAAELFKNGAADFHKQLIKGDLSCEYEPEIRNLLKELSGYR
jgi:serine/threonine-protein kinase